MERAALNELLKLFVPLRPPARLRGAGCPSLSSVASSLVVVLAVAIMRCWFIHSSLTLTLVLQQALRPEVSH
eukprot:scaffold1817_cov69-Skeletonema_marinoi.AAC.1